MISQLNVLRFLFCVPFVTSLTFQLNISFLSNRYRLITTDFVRVELCQKYQ